MRGLAVTAVFVLVAGLSAIAAAADPTGRWSLDRDAFMAHMDEALQAELEQVPEAQRAQMEAMMEAMVAGMADELAGEVEFLADGRVIFRDKDGEEAGGRWSEVGGDEIRIDPEEEEGETMRGRIDGDTMQLEAMESGDQAMPMAIILRRQ